MHLNSSFAQVHKDFTLFFICPRKTFFIVEYVLSSSTIIYALISERDFTLLLTCRFTLSCFISNKLSLLLLFISLKVYSTYSVLNIYVPSCSSPASDIITSICFVLVLVAGEVTTPPSYSSKVLNALLWSYPLINIILRVFVIYLFYSIKASCYARTTISPY